MSLDINELQQEYERTKDDGRGNYLNNFVKMPDGNGHVTVRLMPPAKKGLFGKEKNPFFLATRIHRVSNKSVHCPRELNGARWQGQCPICDYYSWLWNESEKKSPDEAEKMQADARSIKPIERYYYNVMVRQQFNEATGEVEKNVGPKILSIGKTLHKRIIRAIVGDKDIDEDPLGDVTHLKKGRDFKIIKTMRQSGSNSYPNYDSSKFLDPEPVGEPTEVEGWLEELHDIASLRVLKETDDLKHDLKVHLGLEQDAATSDFDPTEFQAAGSTEETPTVTDETDTSTAVTDEVANSAETSSKDASTPLADDEFMKDLRNM